MRVAIIHYWLVTMRGGEKVLEALCEMFPDADIFTHVYDPGAVSATIRRHNVTTTFVGRLPRAARYYKSYLPLMPLALEELDLRKYDLIISSESGPAKGIVPMGNAVHVCYCHSPMRYVWNMYHDYSARSGRLKRFLMKPLTHYIRNWDAVSAQRVDGFVANSDNVRHRIRRYYNRGASVVYPPVAVADFGPVPPDELGDYHLMVGELVAYKRPDLTVEAFNRTGQKLVVIGGGEMLETVRKMAGSSVTILGPQPFNVLRHHYARCRSLVFPGDEDFGIVPIEAMASGRPVLAYRRGGALETVVDGVTGLFFDDQSVEAIIDGVARMEAALATGIFDSAAIVDHAMQFSPDRFHSRMEAVLAAHVRAARQERALNGPQGSQIPSRKDIAE
ncbi:glycosyltransferase family 4 protein (plasmid) [Paracoccus liaowanqingii]|uniref:Glycosyltransferase family 4 protein n=1 Tax=Paracoccus liaowanqingii TaxID=2560053 RepID=A0A4Y5SVV3_9RHOB|nr:glycosyltransferase [Paracoccus liaowanqingii]QDA37008.1 glycosyltransferase family 4 protein [Paracoccus liaowanqingii]